MHVAAGFGVGFGLFMVEDFLQDSFEQIVFILRSRCKGVRFEHMANSGGETGACLLGTRDFVLRVLVLFDAGNNHLFICGQRLQAVVIRLGAILRAERV